MNYHFKRWAVCLIIKFSAKQYLGTNNCFRNVFMYRLRRMHLCFEGMISRWIEIEIMMYQFFYQHITDVSSYNILVWGRSANPHDPSCWVKQSGFKRVEFRHKRGSLTSLTVSNSWNKVTNNWHSKQRRGIIKAICLGPSHSLLVQCNIRLRQMQRGWDRLQYRRQTPHVPRH